MITTADAAEALGRWWCQYDAAEFDRWPDLVTADVHFTCRTDTGRTAYEDFVRADLSGRDAVLAWQTAHRRASPYPLRHQASNVHAVARSSGELAFASYLFVTQIVEGRVAPLSSAVVRGSVRVEDGQVRLSELHVVLDSESSMPFDQRPATQD